MLHILLHPFPLSTYLHMSLLHIGRSFFFSIKAPGHVHPI